MHDPVRIWWAPWRVRCGNCWRASHRCALDLGTGGPLSDGTRFTDALPEMYRARSGYRWTS